LVLGVVILIAMPFIIARTKKINESWIEQKKLDDAALEKLRQDFLKGRL
jgi:hypothetical protein